MLTWKRFSFFTKDVIPANELKTKDITCSASGNGLVFLGDNEGGITIMSKEKPKSGGSTMDSAYTFSTYQTNENRPYDQRVTHLHTFKKKNSDKLLVMSVGDGIDPRPQAVQQLARRVSQLQRGDDIDYNNNSGSTNIKPHPAKIKFWKVDPKSLPVLKCSHEIVVFQPPFEEMPITKIAILNDCSQIALGLSDGRVMLIEGIDVTRDSEQTLRRHMFAGVSASGTPVTCLYYTSPRVNKYVNINTMLQQEPELLSNVGNNNNSNRSSSNNNNNNVGENDNSSVNNDNANTIEQELVEQRRREAALAALRQKQQFAKPSLFVGTAKGMLAFPNIANRYPSHKISLRNSCNEFPGCIVDTDCATLSSDGYVVVAQEEGLFYYDSEDRLDCYVCDGKKVFLKWFNTSSKNKDKKGYVILIMDVGRGLQRVNLYDLVNKYSAFSMTLRSSSNAMNTSSNNNNNNNSSSSNNTNNNNNNNTNNSANNATNFGQDIRATANNASLLNVDGKINHLIRQWGCLIIITSTQKVYILKEKGLEEKLNQLFRKHLYQNALKIVSVEQKGMTSGRRTYQIHKMYAEHLFDKGEYSKAIDQYIKTIGGTGVQPSDVIRRFLNAKHPRRIINLTRYLEALHMHRDGGVTPVHTSLLIKCFTKQQDSENIQKFLSTKFGDKFDAKATAQVLRKAGYIQEAASLAERYGESELYLRILLEDLEQWERALEYISQLPFLDAEQALKQNGKLLLQRVPDATTKLLQDMCTQPHETEFIDDYNIDDNTGLPSRETTFLHGKAEDFLSLFVDHPLHLKRFLWHCVHATDVLPVASSPSPMHVEQNIADTENLSNTNGSTHRRARSMRNKTFRLKSTSTLVWNTLLELCLRKDVAQQDIVSRVDTIRMDSGADLNIDNNNTKSMDTNTNNIIQTGGGGTVGRKRGQSMITNANDLVEQETLMLLEDDDASYDSDHAIVLMQQHGFTTGLLFLYEKRKMYNMLLQHYMDMGRNAVNPKQQAKYSREVLDKCKRFGKRDKSLWTQVLSYFCHSNDEHADDKLRQVLKCIEAENILDPMMVLKIISKKPSLQLSVVQNYIVGHIEAEKRQMEKDVRDIETLKAQIDMIKNDNEKLSTRAKIFTNTKCHFTGHPLDLPVIHFMSGYSYNLENVPDSADGKRECPKTAHESRRIFEMSEALNLKSTHHESFFRELKFSTQDGGDGFDKVAEYFGKNLFSNTDKSTSTSVSNNRDGKMASISEMY